LRRLESDLGMVPLNSLPLRTSVVRVAARRLPMFAGELAAEVVLG